MFIYDQIDNSQIPSCQRSL